MITVTHYQYRSTNRWCDHNHDQDHYDDHHEHCHFQQGEPIVCFE